MVPSCPAFLEHTQAAGMIKPRTHCVLVLVISLSGHGDILEQHILGRSHLYNRHHHSDISWLLFMAAV